MHTLQTGLKDPELEALAVADIRAAEESAVALALRTEWLLMCGQRLMPTEVMYDARRDSKGLPVFIVRAQNGYHESPESFEHALELLVDSHRTRPEDLFENHQRMMALTGCSLKDARRRCAEMAKSASGDPDTRFLHALDLFEAHLIEDDRKSKAEAATRNLGGLTTR